MLIWLTVDVDMVVVVMVGATFVVVRLAIPMVADW